VDMVRVEASCVRNVPSTFKGLSLGSYSSGTLARACVFALHNSADRRAWQTINPSHPALTCSHTERRH
jgi:hypothetical protein